MTTTTQPSMRTAMETDRGRIQKVVTDTDRKVDAIGVRLSAVESRLAAVESSLVTMSQKLDDAIARLEVIQTWTDTKDRRDFAKGCD